MTSSLFVVVVLAAGQPAFPAQNSVSREIDAMLRESEIERALRRFGEAARPLIQEYDAAGARILNGCDNETARRFLAWHADPEGLNRLPDPEAFMRVASREGNTGGVVRWAMEHGTELRDPDALAVFLADPREFVRGYKSLAREAAKRRATKVPPAGAIRWQLDDPTLRVLVAAGAFVVVWLTMRQGRKLMQRRA